MLLKTPSKLRNCDQTALIVDRTGHLPKEKTNKKRDGEGDVAKTDFRSPKKALRARENFFGGRSLVHGEGPLWAPRQKNRVGNGRYRRARRRQIRPGGA